MKTPYQHILSALVLVLLLCSCSNKEDATPIKAKFYGESPEMFLHCSDDGTIHQGVSVSAVYNDDYLTADIWIHGLNLCGSSSSSEIHLTEVPWQFSIGSPTTERAAVVDNITSTESTDAPITFSEFKFVYCLANELDPQNCRGVLLSFVADGHHYTGYPNHLMCQGTTVVSTPERAISDMSIDYDTYVTLDFNPTGSKASAVITLLQLPGVEEPLTFRLSDLQLTLADNAFSITQHTPVAVNDSITVSDLSGNATLTDRLDVTFNADTPSGNFAIACKLKPNFFDTPTTQSLPR